jgi:hypothetical protein
MVSSTIDFVGNDAVVLVAGITALLAVIVRLASIALNMDVQIRVQRAEAEVRIAEARLRAAELKVRQAEVEMRTAVEAGSDTNYDNDARYLAALQAERSLELIESWDVPLRGSTREPADTTE